MLRGGTAAAADNAGAFTPERECVIAEIFRSGRVHHAAFYLLRPAGIGHYREAAIGHGFAHQFEDFEQLVGPSRTVDADHIGTGSLEAAGDLGRGIPQQGAVVAGEGHGGDHGQLGGGGFGSFHTLDDLVKVGEGFQNDQVNSGFSQGADLFLKCVKSLFGLHAAEGGQAHAQRTNIPGNENVFERSFDHFAGQDHPGSVDLFHFIGQPMLCQFEAVGAEGVGLDHPGTSLDVITVHFGHQRGLFQVERVKAGLQFDPAAVQQGAHGAV